MKIVKKNQLKIFIFTAVEKYCMFHGCVFVMTLSKYLNTVVSGVGSSPALATCETSQVLLAGVSGDFPGVLPFRPTYRLARLY